MSRITVLFLLSILHCTATNTPSDKDSKTTDLDAFLTSMMMQFDVPGLAVVLTKNDSIFFQKSYGYSNLDTKEKLTIGHNFHFASVAKTFVTMGIMQLVDEEKLDLEMNIIELLPNLRTQDDSFDDITILHLLNHTSGMGDVEEYGWDDPKFGETELADFVSSFKHDTLLFSPGSSWSYSNNGFAVLAHIIAQSSGLPFEDFMMDRIFKPLEMNHSTFFYPEIALDRRSAPHSWSGKRFVSDTYPYNRKHAGSSTLNTCLDDMAKYAMYHLDMYQKKDSSLLTVEKHNRMWTKSLDLENAPNIGLGWFLGTHRGTKSVWHGGRDLGYTSYVVLLPDANISATVVSNYQLAPIDWIANGMLDIALDHPPEAYRRHIGFELFEKYTQLGSDSAIEYYKSIERDSVLASRYIMGTDGIIPLVNFCINNTSKEVANKLAKLNIDLHPKSTKALNNYGTTLLALDSMALAKEIFQQVLTLDPENNFAKNQMALSTLLPKDTEHLLKIEKRQRLQNDSNQFELEFTHEEWDPEQSVLIVCDMWNKHWCPDATQRVEEIAPIMNEVVKTAREQGVFIIHAPSDVTDFYAGHPARERAINAPKSAQLPSEIQSWCDWLDEDEEKVYPIDQSDGGCECEDCPSYNAWTRQVEAIGIHDEDAISADGEDIWNLMEARGIQHVMIMGVHTNMCVLGRPFGLRNMARYGKNVVLIRDLTDTMYNPKSWPYVDHFTGTDLIVEHIEKYVCPTITSTTFTGADPFRFAGDDR